MVRAARHVSRILKSRVFGFQKKNFVFENALPDFIINDYVFIANPKSARNDTFIDFHYEKPLLDTFWVFVNTIISVSFQNFASMVESLQLVLSKNTVKMSCSAEYYVKLSFRATFQILELLLN